MANSITNDNDIEIANRKAKTAKRVVINVISVINSIIGIIAVSQGYKEMHKPDQIVLISSGDSK